MKYSKGDKIRIRNIDWYEQMLSIPSKLVWQNKLTEDFIGIWCGSHVFRKEMCEFCGRVMTIQEVGIDFYLMEEDKMGYEFTDEMIAGEDVSWMYDGKLVAERFSDDKEVPKFKKDDRVETHDGLFGYIEDIEYDGVRNCYQYYVSFIVDGGYYYEDQLKSYKRDMEEIDSKVPKFKVGDMIVKVGGLSNGYLVTSVSDEYYGLSLSLPYCNGVSVLPVAEQDEWVLLSAGDKKIEGIVEEAKPKYEDEIELVGYSTPSYLVCPSGYEFRDENNNVIKAKKIILEKKKKEYPKTYEECLSVLKIKGYDIVTYVPSWTEYEKALYQKVLKLRELIICRDAYWKIAGEEMGLDKSWEPDFTNDDEERYGIYTAANKVVKDFCGVGDVNTVLTFPTEEMRDVFYEVFKELIEECKELL